MWHCLYVPFLIPPCMLWDLFFSILIADVTSITLCCIEYNAVEKQFSIIGHKFAVHFYHVMFVLIEITFYMNKHIYSMISRMLRKHTLKYFYQVLTNAKSILESSNIFITFDKNLSSKHCYILYIILSSCIVFHKLTITMLSTKGSVFYLYL